MPSMHGSNKIKNFVIVVAQWKEEDPVLYRLYISNSYLMHSFILKGEVPPVCVEGNTLITIKYILIECADLLAVRKK